MTRQETGSWVGRQLVGEFRGEEEVTGTGQETHNKHSNAPLTEQHSQRRRRIADVKLEADSKEVE
ncbi:hypothetical protein Patl1_14287 [Pistacia atlantica]|uniref:Uncharacterized protein n=1 Tax=Pistacia atlantica TaxID=434234 RepID=A0ACC1ASJ4_9ROSI|nr:hypothetical protein Patl1_14287 [Pistacia atlantica]